MGTGLRKALGTDREFVAEVYQRHGIHRTTTYSDLTVVQSLLPMLGNASRDFHRWSTNEMLIATYKMAEKRKDSKTMERVATVHDYRRPACAGYRANSQHPVKD